jgi:hypothetical protein
LWACYWATIHIHYFVLWMDQHQNPPYLVLRTISKNKVINIIYKIWRLKNDEKNMGGVSRWFAYQGI